jgi:predicted kinase
MNTLILTVGLPRSGKSTWAQKQGHPIVCPDAIRLALHGQTFVAQAEPLVWAMARYMVAALFLAGHTTVILDATNTSRREDWLSDKWHTVLHLVDTGAAECRSRAKAHGQEYLLPIIDHMSAALRKDPVIGHDARMVWEFV